jgi:hypothetical protein
LFERRRWVVHGKVLTYERMSTQGGDEQEDREDRMDAQQAALLAAHFTVVRYDRGGSGDTAPHAAEQKIETLEALINGTGRVVLVLGASSGEVLGLKAAGFPCGAGRNVFRREGEYRSVCYEGSVVRLKDTKGLRHLAHLLAHPGREFHAADLEAADSRAARRPPLGQKGGWAGDGERAGGGSPAGSRYPAAGPSAVRLADQSGLVRIGWSDACAAAGRQGA